MPGRILVIGGPSGVGKTEILLPLAQGLGAPVEVISADAFQIYRGLEIGTAKPSLSLRNQIPHHLIDIEDISDGFSVYDFENHATKAFDEISARNAVAILCGGTAYYIKHFLWGSPGTPRVEPSIREVVRLKAAERGIDALHEELRTLDPESAGRIHRNDSYRVTRAMEIVLATGHPVSHFTRQSEKALWDFVFIYLRRERDELYARADRRVDDMFQAGLAEEVADLVRRGYRPEDPGMKAIGYREFMKAGFPHSCPAGSLDKIKQEIKLNTRHYIKRQETFFRSLPGIRIVNAGQPESALDSIIAAWTSEP